MGFAKRMLEARQNQRRIAADLTVEAGALEECEYHEELYEGDGDIDAAFEVAARKFESGELGDAFESAEELRSVLEDVIQPQPEQCTYCERLNAD